MAEEAEVAQVPAENAAPNAGETASPAAAPVSGEEKPAETIKTLTQDEVDQIVAKRLAKAERKWQREADRRVQEVMERSKPNERPAAPAKPVPDQFKNADGSINSEGYIEAVADWKAEQKIGEKLSQFEKQGREREQQRHQEQAVAAYREREEVAREKYDDFDSVVYSPTLPITDTMAQTMQESEQGCEIAYFLGKNPQEAARIAKLSPFLQAKELGRLEAKLAAEPPAKKPSAAPEPINPVKPAGNSGFVDTTDPKSLEKLGTSAWIEAERQRQRREWEARHR